MSGAAFGQLAGTTTGRAVARRRLARCSARGLLPQRQQIGDSPETALVFSSSIHIKIIFY
jgi:hypothetical protein